MAQMAQITLTLQFISLGLKSLTKITGILLTVSRCMDSLFYFYLFYFFFYHTDLSVICRRVLTKNSANSATCSVLLYDIASNRSTNSKPSWAFFPSVVIKSKNRMRCWRKAPGKISSHQKRGFIYLFINSFIYFWLVCLWMVQRWLDYKDWDLTARWETLWDHLFYFYFSLSGSHLWDQDLESFS